MATALKTGTEVMPILGDTIDSVVPTPQNTSTTLVFADDRSITVDSTAGDVTHLLPDPLVQPGAVFEMKRLNAAGNVVRYQAGGGNTIDGLAFFNLTNANQSVKIVSDNTATWRVIATSGFETLPGGSNTEIQFNNNGVFEGISGIKTDGTNLDVSGRIDGDGSGGLLHLKGRDNSPTGGPVKIQGGGASNLGGKVEILGGSGTNSGGNIELRGGEGPNAQGGSIIAIAGNAGSDDGSGAGGDILLTAGTGGFDSGKGGDVVILSGGAEGSGEDSGEIFIDAGTSQQGNIGDILLARASGSVGIGVGFVVGSAVFEIDSTTQGVLHPRMTTTQRDAISSPATGLEIYNTTTNQPEFFNGSIWDAPGLLTLAQVLATGNTTGGSNISVSSGDSIVSPDGTNGIELIIKSGDGSSGNGGDLNLESGGGFGSGGALNLTSGDGAFAGGTININSGSASSSNSAGGLISLQGGGSSGTSSGAQVHVFGGIGGDNSGTGGQVLIHAGGGGNSNGDGGLLSLEGGQGFASGPSSNGGDVQINGGDKFGTGIHGNVLLNTDGDFGFVGIGISNPTFILDVESNFSGNLLRLSADIGNSAALMALNSERTTGGNVGIINFAHNNVTVAQILGIVTNEPSDFGDLRFSTKGTGGFLPHMTIDEDGKVGMGTTDPKSNLQILTSGVSGLGTVPSDRGVVITGNLGSGRLYFEAPDAISTERVFSLAPESGGALEFSSHNDAGSGFITENILTMGMDGRVGVGTGNVALSAAFEILSDARGFLQPRLTEAQRIGMSSPATGLSIHNTTIRRRQFFEDDTWYVSSTVAPNTLEIFTAEDLDDLASGGVISITSQTVILLKADITTSNRFDVASGSVRLSITSDGEEYALTYDGADTFITSIDSFIIIKSPLVATGGGTFFDVSGGLGTIINVDFQGLQGWKMGTVRRSPNAAVGPAVFFLHMAAIDWQDTLTLENVSVFTVDEIALIPFAGAGVPFIEIKGDTPGSYAINLVTGDLRAGESLIRIDPGIAAASSILVAGSTVSGTIFDVSGGTTGTFADVFDVSVALTTIDSVTDSSGVARFNFTVGPTLFVNQQVDISNFVTQTNYNQTGIITATGAGFFEIASIAFTADDATGDFSSDSVQMFETATTLVDGDTLTIDTDDGTEYDGGATVYDKQTNTFKINRVFTFTVSGTWSTAGIDQSDPRVLATDNPSAASSKFIAFGTLNGNTDVTTTTDGTYAAIVVTGTIQDGATERFKLIDSDAGIFEYTGNEPFSGLINASIFALKSGATENYRFAESINGAIPVFASEPYTPMEVKTTKVPSPFLASINLSKGDTFQIMAAGDGTADSLTITDMNINLQ